MTRLANKVSQSDRLASLPDFPSSNTDHAVFRTRSRLSIFLAILVIAGLCCIAGYHFESIVLFISVITLLPPFNMFFLMVVFSLFLVNKNQRE